MLDQIETYINLNNIHHLTKCDLKNISVPFALEEEIQRKILKDSGYGVGKFNSMTIYFYKTGEINGSTCVKIPLRRSSIFNIENNGKYCLLWSLLAHIHPIADPENGHSARVSICRQHFSELNNNGFDFNNGLKCSDMHKLQRL